MQEWTKRWFVVDFDHDIFGKSARAYYHVMNKYNITEREALFVNRLTAHMDSELLTKVVHGFFSCSEQEAKDIVEGANAPPSVENMQVWKDMFERAVRGK